jgi:hypothetical protein
VRNVPALRGGRKALWPGGRRLANFRAAYDGTFRFASSCSNTTAAGAVPPIVPLSLLEALRNLDTPVEDGLDELAGEIVSKRLGLSSTVAAQIQRYQYALRRGGRVPLDECVAVFRLVSRRPDAALVFADAGGRPPDMPPARARCARALISATQAS